MAMKWEDIRRGTPRQLLSEEEKRLQIERLVRLDKFCDGIEPTPQVLILAERYRLGEITFAEFETAVRAWAPGDE